MGRQDERTGPLGCGHLGGLYLLALVAKPDQKALVQAYYERNKEGVFIDRGRQMPEGPPLLKERHHLTDKAAEQMWLSLQTQGWKPFEEPAWVETADF